MELAGSPVATDWGKYMVGIRSGPLGDTNSNGWVRPIKVTNGITHWLGTWVDGGNGAELWTYSGGVWSLNSATYASNPANLSVSKDATGLVVNVNVSSLALGPGETFLFDVYSSGGGGSDSAIDALSDPNASVTGWGGPFTTTNPVAFTMPGSLTSFAGWVASWGLTGTNATESADPDGDTLTNLQEYNADPQTRPDLADTDSDGLRDDYETLTGIFVSATDTGTAPTIPDTDQDGVNDGDEVTGTGGATYPRSPVRHNYPLIAVPGNHPNLGPWDPTGFAGNVMTQVGTNNLTVQYQYYFDTYFGAPGYSLTNKFTAGTWATNWGGANGTLFLNGSDISTILGPSGRYRFFFDQVALTNSLVRIDYSLLGTNAYYTDYATTDSSDDDLDNLTGAQEFAIGTDPGNPDTDGDGLNDDVDPSPLVTPLPNRDVTFIVDMRVMIDLGYFNVGSDTVRIIGQYWNGFSTTSGVVLSDTNADGIYEATTNLVGVAGSGIGGFKAFNSAGTPNSGYETGADRTLVLGATNVPQTVNLGFFRTDNYYREYAVSYGLRGANGDFGVDYDNDSLNNGLEFVLSTNPAANGSLTNALPTVTNDGTNMVFQFRYNTAAGYLNPRAEFSNDLLAWVTAVNGTNGVVITTDANFYGAGVNRVNVSVPVSGQPQQTIRLRANTGQ